MKTKINIDDVIDYSLMFISNHEKVFYILYLIAVFYLIYKVI
jgi:cell division protein FtsL